METDPGEARGVAIVRQDRPVEKKVCAYISPARSRAEVPQEHSPPQQGAVANLQRSREPFVGRETCGQSGESSVEHTWMHRKRGSNRLFLLSFFEALPVHEKGLAKRGGPYYAWCSSGTSTQDIVDFDLEALSRQPAGDRAGGGRGAASKSECADPPPSSRAAARETTVPGAKCVAGLNNDKFRQESNPCKSPALPPRRIRPHVMYSRQRPEAPCPRPILVSPSTR